MPKLNLGICVALLTLCASLPSAARDYPTVDPKEIVAKFGRPDVSESTEYDKPRPPFVTRLLRYKKERVEFVFLANAPIGSPPPYSSWKLMGAIDPVDKTVIPMAEAERRLASRRKN